LKYARVGAGCLLKDDVSDLMSEPRQSEKAIFEAALPMSAEQRTTYLDATCGVNSQLRRRVDALLAAHGSTTPPDPASHRDGSSDTATADDDATISETTVSDTVTLASEEAPGDVIGRYKIVERIGEGGFGMVYVAEQTEPVKRLVALKITKLGMDTRQVVARFEAERQALALMEHPNIAKVLDAGATDTGRPYFVMELVRGTKITEYCDQHKLSTRKRLDLFIQVCRAVEHAHQKGIIHRDIKPSNILVTINDGVAVPKVIDFGIAKAVQGNLTENVVHTQYDQFIGTPAYMSPEQAEVGGLDIDTRSDIYSLGVLLYELLTGETPLESKNLLARGYDEVRRLIRDWEPQRPSIRLDKQKAGKETTTIATRHGTDTPKLIKMVRGDLDWVVMKCLEKDRTRRYDSAVQLTSDIQRFLNNEPVMARPPSNLYRFQKLVRRNRLAFAAGTVILVSLVVGLCVSSWSVVKEREARQMAERDRRNSQSDLIIAKEALKQSDIDRKHAEESLQQSELDRAKAVAAEKKAENSEKEAEAARQQAEAARQQAETARQQAEAALQQAQEDRNKAILAEKAARDSQSQAQTAQQQAKEAETRAISEASKREEAAKAAAYEASLRQQAEAARDQAEAFLQQAKIARQQAEAAAKAALAEAAALTDAAFSGNVAEAALAEASRSRTAISNYLGRLDALPPAEALKNGNVFFAPGDEKQPWAARFLRGRGAWNARQGDWENAIADFSKALDLEPDNPESYDALAPLLAQSGAPDAFGRHCARFLARFGATNDPSILRLVAKDCLLAPLSGTDTGTVAALARRAVATGTNDNLLYNDQLTLGLAEYRQGHYAEAADWTGKALAGSGQNACCAAQACAALAMAQQQLQQTDNARATLAQGAQIMETKMPKLESGDLGPEWSQWLTARVLMREAAALVNGPTAAK
jgi:serine/threonine protein kinase